MQIKSFESNSRESMLMFIKSNNLEFFNALSPSRQFISNFSVSFVIDFITQSLLIASAGWLSLNTERLNLLFKVWFLLINAFWNPDEPNISNVFTSINFEQKKTSLFILQKLDAFSFLVFSDKNKYF